MLKWIKARNTYNYKVDLNEFTGANNNPGYFNCIITPKNLVMFENRFTRSVKRGVSFEAAGEVCFWKVYKFPNRDGLTKRLLNHLSVPRNWSEFRKALHEIADNPSYGNFKRLQRSCSQPAGFALPLTFLAFYRPAAYPMADRHIANWWSENKAKHGYEVFSSFIQENGGRIIPCKQSWDAYLAWKDFCNEYSVKLSKQCKSYWRPRDVEMAVWQAQKKNLSLEKLI